MPAGKRKAEAAPIGLGAPKQGRGGGGRGAGRKPQGVNTKGVDDPGGPKRKQIDLGDVFGGAFSKKNNISDLLGARKGAGAAGADVIEWDYDDGEDDGIILQKQAVGGRVQYDYEKDSLAVLHRKGPEVYYVNKDNGLEEVQATHAKAERAERHAGKLLITSSRRALTRSLTDRRLGWLR